VPETGNSNCRSRAVSLHWPKIFDIQTDICILVHIYVRLFLLGNQSP
jgi:hypothetical protein